MEYYFGEWRFYPEYLLLHKRGSSVHDLNRAFSMLETQRKRKENIDITLNNKAQKEIGESGLFNPIGICPTYSCNLRCNYCGYSSEENLSNPIRMDMVEPFLTNVVKRYLVFKKLKRVDEPLTLFMTGGGEPTYEWSRFKDIIVFFKQLCKYHSITDYISITTNGLLNNAQIDFLSQNVQKIMVSYDGLPIVQNRNRPSAQGKATNEIVENTIRRLSSAGVKLTIRSTLWPENFEDMFEMYSHVYSLIENTEMFTWSVNPVASEGRALEGQHSKADESFLTCYLALTDRVIRTYGENTAKQVETPFITNNYSCLFCGATNGTQPWLMPNGDIIACLESPYFRSIVGRVENGLVHYYQNNNMIRDAVKEQTEKCKDCIAVGFCNGGCLVWFTRCNNNEVEPPECRAQRAYCHTLVTSLVEGRYSFGWQLEPIPGFDSESIRIMVK